MTTPPDQILVHDLVATADLLLRESTRLFRPHGLTAAQFNVLNLLGGAERAGEEGYTQRRLAEALVVDRSNVTGLIDRMEAAGWVRREADPRDRRVHRLRLTAAGRKLWTRVAPAYAAEVARVAGGLGAAEIASTLGILRRLRAGLEGAAAPSDTEG